jgi:hypothetical protein
MSAGYELRAAKEALKAIYRLFSDVDVMWSNHGSLIFRKGITSGLPLDVFKPIREIMDAPKGWQWHESLTLQLPNGQHVCFFHSKTSNALSVSKSLGMSTVNGHYHTQFSIQRWSSPIAQHFAMVSGCLIDTRSNAFAYDRHQILRPILGASVIIDSQPKLEPMLLDRHLRWTGKLYG